MATEWEESNLAAAAAAIEAYFHSNMYSKKEKKNVTDCRPLADNNAVCV